MNPIVIPDEPIIFNRLLPPGAPASVEEIVTGLGLHERPPALSESPERTGSSSSSQPPRAPTAPTGSPVAVAVTTPEPRRRRPYVLLNMVSTLDGRATLDGRSGPLSGPADRALFHGLRCVVDAVIVGAGTVRAERYGALVRDPDRKRLRSRLGLPEQPLACVVSESLALPPDLPLLADPDSHVAIVTSSQASLPPTNARVEYVRAVRDGLLDLPTALAELQDRLHVRTLLCEGGPHLGAELLSAGLLDELFLSLAPKLAGEDAPRAGGTAAPAPAPAAATRSAPLRILAGTTLEPAVEPELAAVLEHDSYLFLRYRLAAADSGD